MDASSKFINIDVLDTSKSSEKSLFPTTPSNGATIFLFFN